MSIDTRRLPDGQRIAVGMDFASTKPYNPPHEPALDWIETLSGLKFNPLDRKPLFTLADLVWGCARACRYAGQISPLHDHYSVAEHTVLMTRWVMDYIRVDRHTVSPAAMSIAVAAACHDLHEGLIGDMPRPMKRGDRRYQEIEDRMCGIVARRYDFPYPLPAIVVEADNRIILDERAQAMAPTDNVWGSNGGLEPLGVKLQFWAPRRAAQELFQLLAELGVHD